MSFTKARQTTEQPHQAEQHSDKCAANGCPLRGSISPNGSAYVCSYHYSAESKDWPRVTETLRQNEKILLAISDVVQTGDIEWIMGKWEMMDRYFEDQPELQPTVAERKHRRWYEYRLNGWMMHLAGLQKDKPIPRDPLPPRKSKGNIAFSFGV